MAKKTSRSEANDITAPGAPEQRPPRGRGQREVTPAAVSSREPASAKLNSVAERPETVSRRLDAAAAQVQQAPGDAGGVRWNDRRDPTEQDIRDRAYQMYLDRGAHHGQDFDDWLRAEDELKQRR